MARSALTRRTTKGGKGKGQKQLNASLPEQLVIDFNKEARERGEHGRDELLKNVLLGFLEKVRPEAKSVRDLQALAAAEARPARHRMTKAQITRLRDVIAQRDALRKAREHAEAIVKITSLRKAPKRAPRPAGRGRKIS